MSAPYDVRSVEHLGGYRLRVCFADGTVRVVDLGAKLTGPVGPVFEPLRDEAFFASASVDAELATVVWSNGADLAPDVLHDGAFDAH
ncbi:MAG: DUF2442 domain-containing protein [Actinomycetota bacterium]|nr:DUF2442 domain-containing protein [Actinomycetota bacterium]